MKNLYKLTLAAAISSVCAMPTFAQEATSITEALKGGDVQLRFRMRYEDVTVTNPGAADGTADVLSLLTRLTYTSKDFNGFGLGLEMDDISHITDMDSMGAGIPDPEGTDVNQYFLSYKIGKSQAKYGRNRIILDNQRFVGGVGFRQNEQTYDSFTFLSKDIENLTVFAAGITGVKRIFGEDATADKGIPKGAFGVHDHRTALLNVNYKFNNAVSLTGYYYGIDNKTFSRYSTDTFGVRATGKAAGFSYEAEVASQSDAGDNTADYSATYFNLGAAYAFKPVTVSFGYESLGEDEGNGRFITPLATLHKFQGWSDVFIVPSAGTGNLTGGIDDLFFKVAGKAGPVKLAAVYHQFDANDSKVAGFDSFGSEIGFVVAGKVQGVGLSLKYADFSADDDSGLKDTTKVWLTADVKF